MTSGLLFGGFLRGLMSFSYALDRSLWLAAGLKIGFLLRVILKKYIFFIRGLRGSISPKPKSDENHEYEKK